VKTSRKLKVEKLKAFVRLGLLTFDLQLLHFLMDRMVAARGAKLFQLQAVLILLLVLRRSVVAVFAVTALQGNNFAHRSLLAVSFQLSAISLHQPVSHAVLLTAGC
jgi:hypothetical protein